MKKLFLILLIFVLPTAAAFLSNTELEQSVKMQGEKTLFVLLTNADNEVLTKMVAPYLMISAKSWEKRVLLVWGPSEKTIAENAGLAELLKKLKDSGVELKACKWCADQYGVGEKLTALGFEVAYMGTPLTEALQNNMKVMVF